MSPTQIDIEGHDQHERVCACGCERSLEGMRRDAVWYSRGCAMRWRRAHPGKSLLTAHSANKGRTRTRHKPSGLQVSFRKAVEALTELLAKPEAERALAKALSPRQRARLEQLQEAA
jgi:hypothetical protein